MHSNAYKEFIPTVAYGSCQLYAKGWHLNTTPGVPAILTLADGNCKHDLSKEDFSQYDYVELNGVRFNKA